MQIKTLEVAGIGPAVPILGHPEYKVTKEGQIIGKTGIILADFIGRDGYRRVSLTENGRTRSYLVHRLVMMTFAHRSDCKQLDVNHKNGDKGDNRLSNLEWCTASENILHAYRTGLERKRIGKANHVAVLTEEAVSDIRAHCIPYKRGKSASDFAKKYSCDHTTILRVLKGMTYNGNQNT